MSARPRRRSAAIALTATLTAGTAGLVSACGPNDPTAAVGTPAGTVSPTGTTAPATHGSTAPAGRSTAHPVNGTANSALTISNGTRYVLMNGSSVDFGTGVHDLSWSPYGNKAAFIDSAGDLVVSAPDGSARTVVAKNPGGQVWSHPTWQTAQKDVQDDIPAKNNLLFAATVGGVPRLETVPATAVNGTPKPLSLDTSSEPGSPALPKTGNLWPNAGGTHGSSVYANPGSGEVYIRDDYLRQLGFPLAPGSEPAMAPTDDEDIVFVRSTGGHDHLFLSENGDDGRTLKDLTPHATTDYTEPAWSPDGRTVAARTPAGIVTLPADGSAAPKQVSTYTGLPAYR